MLISNSVETLLIYRKLTSKYNHQTSLYLRLSRQEGDNKIDNLEFILKKMV